MNKNIILPKHVCLIVVTTLLLCSGSTIGQETTGLSPLSDVLRQAATDVIQHCKQNEIESVGVLKFLVNDGKEFADNKGTINTLLAKRLEVALVFANDPRNPITLVDNASATANRILGASHVSSEGRKKLFSSDYQAMWGESKIKPALLISGVASLSSDLKRIEFSVLGASENPNELKQIGEDYVASTTPAVLTELGREFFYSRSFR